ncbi:MAG: GWxTD domain-containing protein [Acidobacteriota bacterium]|nr:GWxTD domain-containing protein [Acidobacteriota bacterium]
MKNKFLIIAILAFGCFFAVATGVKAQQSSVSFNKKGISLIFNIKTTSPDASRQSFGSVYFTGYDDGEKESRVHRVLADRASGEYFGYDLVVEADAAPNKFKVSIRPLSITPPEQMHLNDLTARSLPKYPEDMIVEDGDTISLDVLVNPQTKVKIADLIKITTKKPQSDSPVFNTTFNSGFSTSAGFDSNDSSTSKQNPQDFTLDAVKMRLTKPKLLVGGAVSPIRGSKFNGIIEGSVLYIYVPEKGRFILSLFQRDGFNFQKDAVMENNKISFQSNGERYELISDAPITSGGGNWNLWIFNDAGYKPDETFGYASVDYIQYGAADAVDYLLTRKQRRLNSNSSAQETPKAVYQKWLNEDVRYIATDAEKQSFSQLKTDEEREQFIESFWQRRDPKPETKENEFRREYYNRIAYANQNFAFGETVGYLTDRGRVYIIHGKPDEIQKNGSVEVWTYKSLAGVGNNIKFEFVDTAKNGDFRLR